MNAPQHQYPGTPGAGSGAPDESAPDPRNPTFHGPDSRGPDSRGPDTRGPVPEAGGPSARPSAATTAITVSTAVVGGIALLVAGSSAAFGMAFPRVGFGSWSAGQGEEWVDPAVDEGSWTDDPGMLNGETVEQSTPVDGVTGLDVDVAAGLLVIEFGEVEDARLESADDRALDWNLTVDGSTLTVESPEDGFGATRGCLFGCGNGTGDDARRVTLTLPRSLAETGALDADVSVVAGSVRMEGDFRDLGVDVRAGEVTVEGTARSIELDVSTGSASVSLADVDTAEASVETGQAEIVLGGDAPASVGVGVDLGSLTLELPEEKYRVDIDDGPSKVQNELDTDAKSKHVVSADLGAGELILR